MSSCTLDSSRDEGISIPKREPQRFEDDSALAKSLPMRVPVSLNYRSHCIDTEDDKVSPIFMSLGTHYCKVFFAYRRLKTRPKWKPQLKL